MQKGSVFGGARSEDSLHNSRGVMVVMVVMGVGCGRRSEAWVRCERLRGRGCLSTELDSRL